MTTTPSSPARRSTPKAPLRPQPQHLRSEKPLALSFQQEPSQRNGNSTDLGRKRPGRKGCPSRPWAALGSHLLQPPCPPCQAQVPPLPRWAALLRHGPQSPLVTCRAPGSCQRGNWPVCGDLIQRGEARWWFQWCSSALHPGNPWSPKAQHRPAAPLLKMRFVENEREPAHLL